jgi:hypothetical protein
VRVGSKLAPVVLAALLATVPVFAGCSRAPSVEAEITAFERPEGSIQAGSPTIASVRLKNTGAEGQTFFVIYSVRDPAGEWYDAPLNHVDLEPGEESDPRELRTQSLETPGYYNSRLSVWSEEPGSDSEARRLADLEEVSTFRSPRPERTSTR